MVVEDSLYIVNVSDNLPALEVISDIEQNLALVLALLHEVDGAELVLLGKAVHAAKESPGETEVGDSFTKVSKGGGHVEVAEPESGEEAETKDVLALNKFLFVYFPSQVVVVDKVLVLVLEGDVLNEVEVGFVDGLQVLTLNQAREAFVVLHRSVLDLVKLVQLAFEHYELLALCGVEVDEVVLELLKGVGHLVEVLLGQEEGKVAILDLGHDLLNWDHKPVLLEVALQAVVLELLEPGVRA